MGNQFIYNLHWMTNDFVKKKKNPEKILKAYRVHHEEK